MKKLSALALGTALALSMPLASLAQDIGVGVDVDAGNEGVEAGVDAGAEAGGADAGVQAGVSAEAGEASDHTYADLDAALQGAADVDLSSVTADTRIEIVDISSLSDEGDFTAEAFDGSRAAYESDISSLRSSVEANADITAALEAEGHVADDVVAVWSQADGTLTVFVESETSPEEEAAQDAGLTPDAEAGAEAGGEAGAGGETAPQP